MAGYQQLMIVGNLGGDPELRYLPSGVAVCNFSVAVDEVSGSGEDRKETTEWFRVAAWRELGERCNQYLRKGRQVMVIGAVHKRDYVDSSGQARSSNEVTAREVRFLGQRTLSETEDDETQTDLQTADEIPF